jgi:uroporphyrin-III C-methyltransferase
MPREMKMGTVRLVGAGPGAAELLTLRAARLIGEARVLLYDALVGEDVLALAPAACLRILAGKRAGRPSMRQETINRLMLRLARRGTDVVRLKGGDPSVFGRVGEEVDFLAAHGVPVEVTPGVTAACAAAAQFRFPLTHRGAARRVLFVTARLERGELVGDWRAAADPETTVAIHMGGACADRIAARLIEAGRAPRTPVLVVESAGSPDARPRAMTLADLARQAPPPADGPVLMVVGEVAGRAAVDIPLTLEDRHALRA